MFNSPRLARAYRKFQESETAEPPAPCVHLVVRRTFDFPYDGTALVCESCGDLVGRLATKFELVKEAA